MSSVGRLFSDPRALPRWSVATLLANIGIVVTGGVVRLTDSGLGCPTWPRCTPESFIPHPALGVHGVIEFGNRLLTFLLVIIAVATWLSARRVREDGRPRRDLRRLTTALALGIPAQGVIGGISVLTDLNPYVVSLHLLASLLLIGLAVALVRKAYRIPPHAVPSAAFWLARGTLVLMAAALVLGTMVTGSGPHAGDAEARRNGLDPALLSHIHAWVVYATIAATIACLWAVRSRAVVVLLCVELVQAGIGLAQYRLGLPIALVALHLLGAALAIAAAVNLALSVTPRSSAGEGEQILLTPVGEEDGGHVLPTMPGR